MIYEFKCDKCNKLTELELSIRDDKTGLKCDCGGNLNRIWSTVFSDMSKVSSGNSHQGVH